MNKTIRFACEVDAIHLYYPVEGITEKMYLHSTYFYAIKLAKEDMSLFNRMVKGCVRDMQEGIIEKDFFLFELDARCSNLY